MIIWRIYRFEVISFSCFIVSIFICELSGMYCLKDSSLSEFCLNSFLWDLLYLLRAGGLTDLTDMIILLSEDGLSFLPCALDEGIKIIEPRGVRACADESRPGWASKGLYLINRCLLDAISEGLGSKQDLTISIHDINKNSKMRTYSITQNPSTRYMPTVCAKSLGMGCPQRQMQKNIPMNML